MGALKLIACLEQLTDRVALRPHELIYRPRRDRWLTELGYPSGFIPLTAGSKRLGERRALGDEAFERQPVQVVCFCHRGETNDY
jgi:hypothetical protein